jgi:hypothetical protein
MPITKALSWRESYENAIQESDNGKLTQYVYETETGIFKRLQELASSSDHHEERAEMDGALADLLAIKIHKLGWPDPTKSSTSVSRIAEVDGPSA